MQQLGARAVGFLVALASGVFLVVAAQREMRDFRLGRLAIQLQVELLNLAFDDVLLVALVLLQGSFFVGLGEEQLELVHHVAWLELVTLLLLELLEDVFVLLPEVLEVVERDVHVAKLHGL